MSPKDMITEQEVYLDAIENMGEGERNEFKEELKDDLLGLLYTIVVCLPFALVLAFGWM